MEKKKVKDLAKGEYFILNPIEKTQCLSSLGKRRIHQGS